MKKLSDTLLLKRIGLLWKELKDNDTLAESVPMQFAFVLNGTLAKFTSMESPNHDYDLFLIVLENCEFYGTPAQLCQIIDEGNHCVSEGSVFYEEDRTIITWSNHGHI